MLFGRPTLRWSRAWQATGVGVTVVEEVVLAVERGLARAVRYTLKTLVRSRANLVT